MDALSSSGHEVGNICRWKINEEQSSAIPKMCQSSASCVRYKHIKCKNNHLVYPITVTHYWCQNNWWIAASLYWRHCAL